MGVIFDLVKMEMSVPEDKKDKALHAIEQAVGNSFVFVDAVQRLLGILVFVGRVLLSGMWHLSRSVMALRVAARNGYVRMSEEWNEELQWWVELLNHWNCKALMVPERWIAPTYDSAFFTDASRSEAKLVGGAGGSSISTPTKLGAWRSPTLRASLTFSSCTSCACCARKILRVEGSSQGVTTRTSATQSTAKNRAPRRWLSWWEKCTS